MVRVILALMVGCAGKATPDTPTDEVTDKTAEPEPAPEPEPEQPATPTSAELYGQCEARVEGPQKDAECTADTDCATTGCGNEVCTTVAEKANVMTTCEDKLCFKILDTCGCHEGKCTWTLKPEVPASQVPIPGPASSLPSSLPPTGGGEDKGEKSKVKDESPKP